MERLWLRTRPISAAGRDNRPNAFHEYPSSTSPHDPLSKCNCVPDRTVRRWRVPSSRLGDSVRVGGVKRGLLQNENPPVKVGYKENPLFLARLLKIQSVISHSTKQSGKPRSPELKEEFGSGYKSVAYLCFRALSRDHKKRLVGPPGAVRATYRLQSEN